MSALLEAINEVNKMSGELAFITGREKGEIDMLLNRDITIDELVIVNSRYDEGKENAVFTITDDPKHYYRTGSSTAVAALKKLAEAMEQDELGWNALRLRFEQVKSKQGRRYYVVKAELTPEAEAELEAREIERVANEVL